jgi:hypothetical protein
MTPRQGNMLCEFPAQHHFSVRVQRCQLILITGRSGFPQGGIR